MLPDVSVQYAEARMLNSRDRTGSEAKMLVAIWRTDLVLDSSISSRPPALGVGNETSPGQQTPTVLYGWERNRAGRTLLVHLL